MYFTSRLLNTNMYLLSFSLLIQIALYGVGVSRRQKCHCVCVRTLIEKLRNWWNNTPVGCGDRMFWSVWNGWSLLTVGNRTVHTTFPITELLYIIPPAYGAEAHIVGVGQNMPDWPPFPWNNFHKTEPSGRKHRNPRMHIEKGFVSHSSDNNG